MRAAQVRAVAIAASLSTLLVQSPARSSGVLPVPVQSQGASRPVTNSPPYPELNLLSSPVTLYPNQPGWYGWGHSVSAAGDVNGDGYADFLVSNKLASPWGSWAVVLYYGSPAGPVSPPGWVQLNYGKPVHVSAAGDVNGDGYDDVVLGAADTSGVGTGTIQVWYGGPGGLGASPSFTQNGDASFGWSVCAAGDVNGDAYDDVIVGDPLNSAERGAATLYYGSATGLSTGSSWSQTSTTLGMRLGISVAGIGDIDGDGYDDLGIGTELRNLGGTTASPGFVYLGGPAGPVSSSSFERDGQFSARLAPAGDMNGDGYADYLFADPFVTDTGKDYEFIGFMAVIHGGPGVSSGSSLGLIGDVDGYMGLGSFTAGDVNGDGLADALVLYPGLGEYGQAHLYLALGRRGVGARTVQSLIFPEATELGDISCSAAGDVNGDGFGDVLVGLPASSDFGALAGKVLLYYGSADRPNALAAERFGGQASAVSGWSLAIGDVNGDGFDDVLVGAPLDDNLGATDNGKVELYLGGESGIAATPVWTGIGYIDGSNAGISVAMGQDINGDGFGDVVVGAHVGGYVAVWFGRSDWSTAINFPDQIISSSQTGSQFGASVAYAGDVNGDGYADVVVGAPNYETVTFQAHTPPVHHPAAGEAFLYLGSPNGLVAGGWSETDNQDNAQEGTSVAGAGDVNSDGYSDVLVGTGSWDGSSTDQGHAKLFLGGPGGLAASPQRTWTGSGASAFFGQAVAGIGDFDGDGYGDVAIGAFNSGSGGQAFVIRGEAAGGGAAPSWTYNGSAPGSAFGSSVSAAGDVDGDGFGDLLVGEVFGDEPSLIDCGHAYVFAGGASPSSTPIATFAGAASLDNLGHSVAGGGDVNGDGFGDLVIGEPRRFSSFNQEGGFRLYLGNSLSSSTAGQLTGHAHLTRAMQPGPPAAPIGLYGMSRSTSTFTLASNATSAAGRERVALDWRVIPPVGGGTGSQGRTPWKAMGPPTDPLGGAVLLSQAVTGLSAGSAYGWKTRVLSRSPWFRYGNWIAPQPNGRGQWDVRTAPGSAAVPTAAAISTDLEFSAAWPSPSRRDVNLEFALPRRGPARLQVRDLQGRSVRTLLDHDLEAGRHSLVWNGAGDDGRTCPAGIYFLELTCGDARAVRRVAIVR